MNLNAYLSYFQQLLDLPNPPAPYDEPQMMEYTRLNHARMKRWTKTLSLDPELVAQLARLQQPMHWIVLLEPWCGDVAPSLPFIMALAQQSPFVSYDLQLRDSEPFLINQYLTNGSKSIPKLIVRNASGTDLFVWGPRPRAAQQLIDRLRSEATPAEEIKKALQHWYNQDGGLSFQNELKALFAGVQAG